MTEKPQGLEPSRDQLTPGETDSLGRQEGWAFQGELLALSEFLHLENTGTVPPSELLTLWNWGWDLRWVGCAAGGQHKDTLPLSGPSASIPLPFTLWTWGGEMSQQPKASRRKSVKMGLHHLGEWGGGRPSVPGMGFGHLHSLDVDWKGRVVVPERPCGSSVA